MGEPLVLTTKNPSKLIGQVSSKWPPEGGLYHVEFSGLSLSGELNDKLKKLAANAEKKAGK